MPVISMPVVVVADAKPVAEHEIVGQCQAANRQYNRCDETAVERTHDRVVGPSLTKNVPMIDVIKADRTDGQRDRPSTVSNSGVTGKKIADRTIVATRVTA
jgi:hypothetical protein